jgi:hypothetical protein
MKRSSILLIFASVLIMGVSHAQETTSRYVKQHLKGTEESIVKALNNESPAIQASAAQTLRQLEWMFPEELFSSLLEPLMRIVQDRKSTRLNSSH